MAARWGLRLTVPALPLCQGWGHHLISDPQASSTRVNYLVHVKSPSLGQFQFLKALAVGRTGSLVEDTRRKRGPAPALQRYRTGLCPGQARLGRGLSGLASQAEVCEDGSGASHLGLGGQVCKQHPGLDFSSTSSRWGMRESGAVGSGETGVGRRQARGSWPEKAWGWLSEWGEGKSARVPTKTHRSLR